MNRLCLQLWPPVNHGLRLVRCTPLYRMQLWMQNQVYLALNAVPRAIFRQLFAFDNTYSCSAPPSDNTDRSVALGWCVRPFSVGSRVSIICWCSLAFRGARRFVNKHQRSGVECCAVAMFPACCRVVCVNEAVSDDLHAPWIKVRRWQRLFTLPSLAFDRIRC